MNLNTIIKSIGAATVLFVGLSAPSAAYAWGGYGGHHGGHHGGHYGGHYGGHHGGYHGGGYHGGGYHGGGYHHGGHYYHHGHYYGSFYSYCRRWGFRHNDYRCYRAFGGGYYYSNEDLGIKDLRFKDLGGRLVAEGTLIGLSGPEAVRLDLEATSDVRSDCGQLGAAERASTPLDIQSQGSRSFEAPDAELDVRIESEDSAALAEEMADCPSARDVSIDEVQFLDARIDVSQGDKVLTLLCTFTVPTVDGEVAADNVECSAF